MKVIIAGGTGLIGKALTKSLFEDGHEVTVLSRSAVAPAGFPGGAHVVRWNGKSPDGWGHLVNEADALVNLAGANLSGGRWTERRKQVILSSRVNAGRAFVQALEQAEQLPAVLVQASGVGHYGVENSALLDEKTPPHARVASRRGRNREEANSHDDSRLVGPVHSSARKKWPSQAAFNH